MSDKRESLPELEFDGPSGTTSAAIREAIAADLHKVVPRSVGTRVGHGVAAAVMVGALTVASYGPDAWAKTLDHTSTWLLGGLITVAAVFLASSAFSPWLKDVGRDTRMLVAAGAVAAWSLYLVSTVTDIAWGSALGEMAVGCAARSFGAGLLGAAAFMWVWRKADPWTPRLSGALIGTCAGIIASTHVGIVCAGGHGGHILVGHWLVVPVLAIAGFAVSRRILAP